MTAILAIAVRYLGVTGIVALGIIIFYEGVPLGPLRYVAFLGPVLTDFVDGRVDRAFRDGETSERLVWQEKERKAFKKRLDEEQAKQAELDAIAAKYRQELDTRISLTLQIVELEQALKEDETDAPPGNAPRPFMPRGVSKRINAIGR